MSNRNSQNPCFGKTKTTISPFFNSGTCKIPTEMLVNPSNAESKYTAGRGSSEYGTTIKISDFTGAVIFDGVKKVPSAYEVPEFKMLGRGVFGSESIVSPLTTPNPAASSNSRICRTNVRFSSDGKSYATHTWNLGAFFKTLTNLSCCWAVIILGCISDCSLRLSPFNDSTSFMCAGQADTSRPKPTTMRAAEIISRHFFLKSKGENPVGLNLIPNNFLVKSNADRSSPATPIATIKSPTISLLSESESDDQNAHIHYKVESFCLYATSGLLILLGIGRVLILIIWRK